MLESVGHPYAVNPDRTLRREALARGWPILDFNRPVRLKQRLPALSVPPRPRWSWRRPWVPRRPLRGSSGTRTGAKR